MGRGREKSAGSWGGGLAPAAAKQKWSGKSRNRAYSSRTHDVFSIQRPLRVGGERRRASWIPRSTFVKQQHGRPMPQDPADFSRPRPNLVCLSVRRLRSPRPGPPQTLLWYRLDDAPDIEDSRQRLSQSRAEKAGRQKDGGGFGGGLSGGADLSRGGNAGKITLDELAKGFKKPHFISNV